jgi:cobalamin biosynthesis Mg chelatase CobN
MTDRHDPGALGTHGEVLSSRRPRRRARPTLAGVALETSTRRQDQVSIETIVIVVVIVLIVLFVLGYFGRSRRA